jgi:fructose-1,6-bisphosphatase/inositol monophosphatase family enzyme
MPSPVDLLPLLHETADAIAAALGGLDDWGLAGTRAGQYRSDLAADRVAVEILTGAGLGVLSEESGVHYEDRELFAVIDPLDGSTNASRRIPWYATSICVLDEEGPLAALVRNQAIGTNYAAVRGEGATRDGLPIHASNSTVLRSSVIGLSGFPRRYLGWSQFRALGAAALDLCCVADGTFDAYLDCSRGAHGAWDYLGGMLVCTEAGAVVGETSGRDLVVRGHEDRRGPAAAATPELLDEVIAVFQASRAEVQR